MSFEIDQDGERPRSSQGRVSGNGGDAAPAGSVQSKSKRRKPNGEVGAALRSVYERTIEERIPPEMLDLLGKLD